MTRIAIRRAEPADAEQCQRMYRNTNVYSGTLQLPHPSVEMWTERLRTPDVNRHLLVALIDDVIVGTGGLHCEPHARRRHAAGIGIGIAEDFARQGIGTALLREMISLADQWLGILRLELTVFSDNAAAIGLYRKFGFEREGTHKSYALRNGVYVDVDAMARLHPHPPQVTPQ